MPNWCEGIIRFRGKEENIISAMTKGLLQEYEGCDPDASIELYKNYAKDDENNSKCLALGFSAENRDNVFYIDDTSRHFVESFEEAIAYRVGDDFIIALWFKAAWRIRAFTDDRYKGLDGFAKKYGVDIRAVGYEQGIGFKQIVEIDRTGKVLVDFHDSYKAKDVEESYGRFLWESEMPLLGG